MVLSDTTATTLRTRCLWEFDRLVRDPDRLHRSSQAAAMKLVDNVVRSFKVAKVFRENTDKINSFDFSPAGDYIISCSEDDQIVIYDSQKGELSKTINSKKYGVDLIHFTHTKTTAIHSSTKVDDTIRYMLWWINVINVCL